MRRLYIFAGSTCINAASREPASTGAYSLAVNLVALVAHNYLEVRNGAAAFDMEVAGDFDRLCPKAVIRQFPSHCATRIAVRKNQ